MREQQPKTRIEARALELFRQSLDQPVSTREQWLRSQCEGAEELFEAVRTLYKADLDSGQFLESGPSLPARTRTGERIGNFELLEPLGQGGMGSVYRARRADGAFEQIVAVKLFNIQHMNEAALRRFDTERRILATLEHPGIARLIDGGEAEDGTPYVVMERVEGVPITEYCEREAIDLAHRLQLIAKICSALSVAHRQGIVHRDIKPSNVLVTADGQPKLIDFGIAKVLDPNTFESSIPETRLEAQAMTPEYASPEQVRNQASSVVSDLYSLGVLMYELLTGRRPYRVAGLSAAQVERVVCEIVPPDPSEFIGRLRAATPAGLADVRQLKTQLRGDVDRIVMTAMHKEPSLRYPSAAALADDIERYLSGLPVQARGASLWYRASKFVGRNKAAATATAVVFLTLIGALVAVSLQAQEAQRQRDVAQQQAAAAEAAQQFLTEMIGRADPFSSEAEPTLANALRASIPDIAERFVDQPELEADMRYAIGYALQSLGQIPEARAQLEQAQRLRDELGDPLDRAQAFDGMGIIHWWETDYAAGSEAFQKALDLLEGHDSETAQRRRFTVLNSWSGMLSESGDYEQSAELAYRALEVIEQSPEAIEILDQATLWSNLATTLEGLDQFDDSLAAFEQSMAIRREEGADQSPDYAITLNNLAYLYLRMDRFDDAVDAQQRSVEILEQALGTDHPEVFITSMNLSRMLVQAGDLELAEYYARRSMEIAVNTIEPTSPRRAKSYEAVAMVLEAQGNVEEALALAIKAREIYRQAEIVNPEWIEVIEVFIQRLQSADASSVNEISANNQP